MKRNLLLSFMLVLGLATLSAQELNCRIQFNTDKIQGTNKQVFTTLQGALMDFAPAHISNSQGSYSK